MEYPLLAAQTSPYVEKIYVSTDDPDIAGVGRRYGAEIIERPPELCTDTALFEDALVHGYFEIKRRLGNIPPKYLVILMCNAPAIDSDLIDRGIESLDKDPNADSAVTVSTYNMWSPLRARRTNVQGYLDPFVPLEVFGDPKTLNCDRDSQGNVHYADMSLSISRPHCLEKLHEGLLPQKWMGRRILPIPNAGACDVDYDWQIPMVEHWLKQKGFSARATPSRKLVKAKQ